METESFMISGAELEQIGQRLFGGRGWQSKLAQELGCSQPHLSQVKSGRATLSQQHCIRLMMLLKDKPNVNIPQQINGKISLTSPEPQVEESDEQIRRRLTNYHNNFEELVTAVCQRKVPSLIVSGPAGIGKSYTVEHVLNSLGIEATYCKGVAKPTGLYSILYHNRDGGIVVLDDCDSIFKDRDSFNILKAALDSTGPRRLSWLSQGNWLEEEGVEKNFNFNGSVIFLTNQDFESIAERGTGISAEFKALMSRCLYVSLGVKTRREIMIKIEQIAPTMLSEQYNLNRDQIDEILSFLKENLHNWRQFSLRELGKICQVYSIGRNWKSLAKDILMHK